MANLNQSVKRMADQICIILNRNVHSIWLYGSVVLDDFRLGWSDIDILVLSNTQITEHQAQQLIGLRQVMLEAEPDNPFYRSFEGIIADKNEYLRGSFSRLVYWGTSGQRITDQYRQDVFSAFELAKYGQCVYGENDRKIFLQPSRAELWDAVKQHYDSIRKYAVQTDEKLCSCGWLLDIARCIYTLRHNDVIAKTRAGAWALTERIFPDEKPLERTVEIRQNPAVYRSRENIKLWLKSLGPVVQQYADVLEKELYIADPCRASSLPFWKTKQLMIPNNITVLREEYFDAAKCSGKDEPYFKLIHHLGKIGQPNLAPSYKLTQRSAEEYARHICECYTEEHISTEELCDYTNRPVFDPDLWISVVDTMNGRIAASGIAEMDPRIREGVLEWIQVSPDYRHQGLGKYIVCELLRRLAGKADFVTVSGKMNNPDNPLALYCSCGFSDCAVWHIIRNDGDSQAL